MKPKNKLLPYLLIGPAVLVLIIMVGYPLFYGVRLSFTNMSLRYFLNPKFIGLDNYTRIFADVELYKITLRTFVWTFINVFFHVSMGMFLALILNRKLPFKNFFRVILMIPWAMPQYIAVITWKNMFRSEYGAIDIILNKIGISGLSWLSDGNLMFVAAIITNIWLGVPFMMTTFLGGLQSIPQEMYEAGDMDGIKAWSKLRHITLPLMRPVMVPAAVLGMIMTFNMVNVIFIISDGTGVDSTHILVTKVYKDAFTYFSYGKAAAMSVIIFLMLAAFSTAFIKILRGDEGVYD
ncbi:MAG: sugar ABC transporter permease [Clostridia bacterium]|nr:sugar ABC transporter permease [Clostridia bacterium]